MSAAEADYGYLTNSVKTILLVKDNLVDEAAMVFSGTGITITAEGTRYLGSAIGKPEFREQFFLNKIEEWKREIEQLAVFAKTEPHAAFAALTMGCEADTHTSYVLCLPLLQVCVCSISFLSHGFYQHLLEETTFQKKNSPC